MFRTLRLAPLLGLIVAPPSLAQVLPYCFDSLVVEASGDTLSVEHRGAAYNCCPVSIDHEVFVGDATIRIVETEVLGDEICLCYCCYDVSVDVLDVGPGPWIVQLEYYEPDVGDWVILETTVTVPNVGQAGLAAEWASADSGCLPPGTPVSEPGSVASWGRLKANWR